jgi:cellulose synthase/poly-beta-1,6-N-acetylglucosamine synthase-like glycosyltransferase
VLLIQINYQIGLFFIAFYVSYWTVKVFESYFYVVKSYFDLLAYNRRSFHDDEIVHTHAALISHVVVVPIYTEPYDVIEENVEAILANDYPNMGSITILLATEARVPDAEVHALAIIRKFSVLSSVKIVNVVHPENLPGEGKVKGSNISYAVMQYEQMMVNTGQTLDAHSVFVSTIDTDTKVEKNFFSIATYRFVTTEYRDQAIYQYTPVYSNNWKEGHFFTRLIAMGTTLWQLFESQNPEFYRNFAVYGQSLKCLQKSDYWSRTSIVEDGLQYWRSYFAWDGMFRIVNVPAVCRMDLVDETNLWRTIKSQYKQLRRWSWGCTDIEFVIPAFAASKTIPLWDKLRKTVYLIQNHLFWAGGAFMLFFIGYIPGIFESLRTSIAVVTVPLASSIIFTILFATVVFPGILSIHIMRRYTKFRKRDYIYSMLQWLVVPVLTLTLFSLPAIESQIRLFFGKRIDSFDTTQKMNRKTP